MRGNNEMVINQITMKEIVQFYFDKKLFKNPNQQVMSVKKNPESRGGMNLSEGFIIELKEKEEEPK